MCWISCSGGSTGKEKAGTGNPCCLDRGWKAVPKDRDVVQSVRLSHRTSLSPNWRARDFLDGYFGGSGGADGHTQQGSGTGTPWALCCDTKLWVLPHWGTHGDCANLRRFSRAKGKVLQGLAQSQAPDQAGMKGWRKKPQTKQKTPTEPPLNLFILCSTL